ncbi:MAG: hypothetical protein Q9212_003245 [Teloschistes hypoglaucus]
MLVLAALFGLAFAYPENARPREADSRLEERGPCYFDDYLESFKYWRLDSEPYCSSLLGVQDLTSTLPSATSRTTTTIVSTELTTASTTFTVAAVTAFTTVTVTASNILKRQNAGTITSTVDVVPTPYYAYNSVPEMVSDASQNASIAASVYSACSCLRLSPKTVSSQATVPYTRTISGYAQGTAAAATVTSGTSTSTITETKVTLSYFPANVSTSANDTNGSPGSPLTETGPITSAGTGLLYPTITSIPYQVTNTTYTYTPAPLTLASTTLTAQDPFATSVGKGGCPTVNNTIYTLPGGQQYQIQCYRTYGGPVAIGIDALHLNECIQICSMANAGFSAIRCFGVSWAPYPTTGLHCNLKAQTSLLNFTTNFFAASAVLLTGVPPPVLGIFDNGRAGGTIVGQLPDDDPGTWRQGKSIDGQLPDDDPGTWRKGKKAS